MSHSKVQIGIAFLSLFIGGIIYVLFRADTLVMFSWFDFLGLSNFIKFLRSLIVNYECHPWVIYNMPAALWLLSYLCIISTIWNKYKNSKLYTVFFWLMPLISILSEFFQLFGILSGTFDVYDVISYIFSIIIYYLIRYLYENKYYLFHKYSHCI